MSEILTEHTTFTLFDQMLESYAPPLDPPNAELVGRLLADRQEQLARMRQKCHEIATELVAVHTDLTLRHIEKAVDTLEEEVRAVAELDHSRWLDLRSNLLGDSGAWVTIAGTASALVGSPLVRGSLALTALASLGAAGVRTKQGFDRALRDSPWSFVYYLKRGV